MGTLKKFRTYFLIFIAFFIVIGFLTNVAMRENFKDISSYEIKCESPVISVDECKATYSHGYIKGTVTNNTGEHLPLKYLQIDLYDKDEIYLGTEYKELKYFNINETINYEINFNYNNVNIVKLQIVDEIPGTGDIAKEKETVGGVEINPMINEDTMKIAVPIAGLLVFYTIIP